MQPRIFLAFALLLSVSLCGAETISSTPANPNSPDAVTLIVSGTTANVFEQPALFGVTVSGTHIRIDVCFVNALVPGPSDYQISAAVGILPSGTYQVESYHVFCVLSGTNLIQLTTPQLSTTAALSVTAAAEAIPAISDLGLTILAVLVLLVGGALPDKGVRHARSHDARD